MFVTEAFLSKKNFIQDAAIECDDFLMAFW